MERLDRSGIQSILLGILKDIDNFCQQNGLRYSLAGGTLLGAVRHKGFIPWDDDADILMPRPDYEKFLATYGGERYTLVPWTNTKADGKQDNFISTHVKVQDTNTISYEGLMKGRYKFGISLDVFPIDGLPSDENERKAVLKKAGSIKRRIKLKQRPFICKLFHQPTAKIEAKCHSLQYWIDLFDEVRKPYRFEDCEWAGALSGIYGVKEAQKKSMFEEYVSLPFEGVQLQCVKDWDGYLSSLYGDYMTPPPGNKRIAKHSLEAYIK